jgi:hypothetical protein
MDGYAHVKEVNKTGDDFWVDNLEVRACPPIIKI